MKGTVISVSEFWWIILCLFGAIGLSQCILWLAAFFRKRRVLPAGYHIIPLYDEPAGIEARLREAMACLQWEDGGRRLVLLADMGLSEESLAVCDRFLRQNPGLVRCEAARIGEVIQRLDHLQGP